MYTNVQETPQRPPYRYQTKKPMATLPEEKPPTAVSVMVPEVDGKITPYRVQIDPARSKIGQSTTASAAAASSVSDAVSAPGQTPGIVPTQPPPAPGPVDQVQDAYKTVVDTQSGALDKHQGRWGSMLESLFAGMADVGPIRDERDLASALSHIAATGVGGLVDKGMGQKLSRPYRVKIAEDRLKQARDVATTTSTVQKRESDEAATKERLKLQKDREKRLTDAHSDVNDDRAKKNILAEFRARPEYDPEDPAEANDPNSLTSRAAKLNMTLGEKTKDERRDPQFTANGIRYSVDKDNVATAISDDKGEVVQDQEFPLKIKERKARIAHIGAMETIANRRESRLAQEQKDNRLDKQAKADADAWAAGEYGNLANELQTKADAADSPNMKRLYTSQAEAARLKAVGLRGSSGAQSLDQRMRGMGSDKEFRQFFIDSYKQAHGGAEPDAVETGNAVKAWKSKYKK